MSSYQLPETLQSFLSIGEASNGNVLAADLFRRRFRSDPPDFGTHIIVYYRQRDGAIYVASYLHFWIKDRMGLVGGGCTDGDVMRRMSAEEAQLVNDAGGLLRQTLLYVFDGCRDGIDAFFGHCGNPRAKEIDLAAGFEETDDQYLLVNWVDESLQPPAKDHIYHKALALGPF